MRPEGVRTFMFRKGVTRGRRHVWVHRTVSHFLILGSGTEGVYSVARSDVTTTEGSDTTSTSSFLPPSRRSTPLFGRGPASTEVRTTTGLESLLLSIWTLSSVTDVTSIVSDLTLPETYYSSFLLGFLLPRMGS